MIYRAMRVHEYCRAGGDGQDVGLCPDSREAQCSACGDLWEPDDTSYVPGCPGCGSRRVRPLRCDTCPVEEVAEIRAHSRAGRLFERLLELEFDISNFGVPWHDLTAEEVRGLQILKDEREKRQRELADRAREEHRRAMGH